MFLGCLSCVHVFVNTIFYIPLGRISPNLQCCCSWDKYELDVKGQGHNNTFVQKGGDICINGSPSSLVKFYFESVVLNI